MHGLSRRASCRPRSSFLPSFFFSPFSPTETNEFDAPREWIEPRPATPLFLPPPSPFFYSAFFLIMKVAWSDEVFHCPSSTASPFFFPPSGFFFSFPLLPGRWLVRSNKEGYGWAGLGKCPVQPQFRVPLPSSFVFLFFPINGSVTSKYKREQTNGQTPPPLPFRPGSPPPLFFLLYLRDEIRLLATLPFSVFFFPSCSILSPRER